MRLIAPLLVVLACASAGAQVVGTPNDPRCVNAQATPSPLDCSDGTCLLCVPAKSDTQEDYDPATLLYCTVLIGPHAIIVRDGHPGMSFEIAVPAGVSGLASEAFCQLDGDDREGQKVTFITIPPAFRPPAAPVLLP